MLSMGVQAVLVVVLLGIATTKAVDPEGYAEFWRSTVELTCPEVGTWYDSNGQIKEKEKINENTFTFTYTSKGQYRCEYNLDTDKKIYQFHVEGNACEDCFELEGQTLLLVIIGDLLMTIIVMIIVYRCTKKKSSAGPPQPSKAPPRSGGRGPPVPSSDYERLNPHTRAEGTYQVVNRMG